MLPTQPCRILWRVGDYPPVFVLSKGCEMIQQIHTLPIEVPNAFARDFRAVQRAYRSITPENLGSRKRFLLLGAEMKRVFDDVPALLGFKRDKNGNLLNAWHQRGREIIVASILEQQGWTTKRYICEIAKAFPEGLDGFHVVFIDVVATLLGYRKETRYLRSPSTEINRGAIDREQDGYHPRIHWRPQKGEDQQYFAVKCGRFVSLACVGEKYETKHLRLFREFPDEVLCKANGAHCDATRRGVEETRLGLNAAEAAAFQEAQVGNQVDVELAMQGVGIAPDAFFAEFQTYWTDRPSLDASEAAAAFATRQSFAEPMHVATWLQGKVEEVAA